MSINHLIIQQTTSSVEVVTYSLIDKLYELAQNSSLDANSTIQGNLQCTHAYEDAVTYLLNKFPGLQINVTSGAYIRFADHEVLRVMMLHGGSGNTTLGDGTGITSINALTISQINNSLFQNNTIISSFNELLSFSSVSYIYDSAFNRCSNLTSIKLDNIRYINQYAFYGCVKLNSIGLTDNIQSISHGAFGNTGLPSISLPNCTSIGNAAFDHSNITYINVPNCINFGTYCFNNCTSLTSAILSNNLTSISDQMFRLCSSLLSFSLTNKVTYIGAEGFNGCTSLTSIGDSSGVSSISNNAFQYCSKLTTCDFTSVISIKAQAFYGSGLTSISLPACTSLLNEVFRNCTNLTNASLPVYNGTGDSLFQQCTNLVTISVPSLQIIPSAFCTYNTKLTTIIDDVISRVNSQAFFNCSNLISINLSNTTIIEGQAFSNCSKLASIGSLANIQLIGVSAFINCNSLNLGALTLNVTTLGDSVFEGTSFAVNQGITSINLPNCTSLGSSTFRYNPIVSANLPVCINLGARQFHLSTIITSINFPVVQIIGDQCFEKVTSLDYLILPNSIQSIGWNTFASTTMRYMKVLAITPPTINATSFDSTTYKFYVPDDSVASYKTATNWSTYASRIFSLTQFATDFPNG